MRPASINDLQAIFLDIKKREKELGLQFVDGIARQHLSNTALQPRESAIVVSLDSLPPVVATAAEL